MGVQHESKGRMLLRGGFVVVVVGERECVRVNINTHYSLPGGGVGWEALFRFGSRFNTWGKRQESSLTQTTVEKGN